MFSVKQWAHLWVSACLMCMLLEAQDQERAISLNKNLLTPLMEAVVWADHTLVQHMIAEGEDINARDKKGNTALHWAIIGQIEMENDSCQGKVGKYTPEQILMMVEMLLAQGANPNVQNKSKLMPLDCALMLCSKEPELFTLEWLESFIARIAPFHGQLGPKTMRLLNGLVKDKARRTVLINCLGCQGETTKKLVCAAYKGDKEEVTKLVGYVNDVNELVPLDMNDFHGSVNALMAAAQAGHQEVVEFLLSCGASVIKQDQMGKNALVYARSHPEMFALMMQTLSKKQAKLLGVILAALIYESHEEKAINALEGNIKQLLQLGVSVEGTYKGCTPLHAALANQEVHGIVVPMLECLLEAGANPTALCEVNGVLMTPIQLAHHTLAGCPERCEQVLALLSGCDAMATNGEESMTENAESEMSVLGMGSQENEMQDCVVDRVCMQLEELVGCLQAIKRLVV